MLYEILKTSKLGASFAPDMYTALWAQKLARDGEVKTLSGIPPLTFRSNGQPLLDYLISGNTVQNGTPTPDNPIQPQGTGEIVTNMLGIYKENYSINANGVETYNNVAMIYKANVGVSGSTFTLNFGGLSAGDTVRIHAYTGDIWKAQIAAIVITQVPFAFTVASEVDNIRISIRKAATDVTMTDGQYKIPISSANTTTPVYLGEVETTRKIKKLVLTGNEVIYYSSTNSTFYFSLNNGYYSGSVRTTPLYCSHYIHIEDGRPFSNLPNNSIYIASFGSDTGGYIYSTDYTDLADFKAYLAAQYAAGTPVTVWYVLAEPETGIVNEPLMKIGEYADTVSYEQAGVQIPTARGTNTLDVLTDVKPSEIYIKYKE